MNLVAVPSLSYKYPIMSEKNWSGLMNGHADKELAGVTAATGVGDPDVGRKFSLGAMGGCDPLTQRNSAAAKMRKSSFQITRVMDPSFVMESDGGDDVDNTRDSTEDLRSTAASILRCQSYSGSMCNGDTSPGVIIGAQVNGLMNGYHVIEEIKPLVNGYHSNENVHSVAATNSATEAILCLTPSRNSSPKLSDKPCPHQADIQSRFKIVKIVSVTRGRWKCQDCAGQDSKSGKVLESPPVINGECGSNTMLAECLDVNIQRQTSIEGSIITVAHLNSSPNLEIITEPIPALPTNFSNSNLGLNCHITASMHYNQATPHYVRTSSSIFSNNSLAAHLSAINGLTPASVIIPSVMSLPQTANNVPVQTGNNPMCNRSRSDPAFTHVVDDSASCLVVAAASQLEHRRSSEQADAGSLVVFNGNGAEAGSDQDQVGLDSKISQAMELVKSHLMFAVHQEIEEMREQIKQLLDRNNHLEHENGILRESATPETLAKLDNPIARLNGLDYCNDQLT